MDTTLFEALHGVMNGKDPFEWELWAKLVEDSEAVTPGAHSLVSDMAIGFATLLGHDFLTKCLQRGATDHPLLYHLHNHAPWVYVYLFDVYAHFALLKQHSPKRFMKVVKNLRTDFSHKIWHHSFMQFEFAGLALRHGYDTEFEPVLNNNKNVGDLKILAPQGNIFIETVQLGTGKHFERTEEYRQRIELVLRHICFREGVQITGELEDILTKTEWVKAIELAAKEAGKNNCTVDVTHSKGGNLLITPSQDTYPLLSGPPTARNEWDEIKYRIEEKLEKQYASTGNVWIRLDDIGGLWYFTPWSQGTLFHKLQQIVPLLQSCIEEYTNCAGVIISNGWGVATPDLTEEVVSIDESSIGVRTFPRTGAFRETFIVGRDKSAHEMASTFARWYTDEPSWTNWALSQLGYPSLDQLVKQ